MASIRRTCRCCFRFAPIRLVALSLLGLAGALISLPESSAQPPAPAPVVKVEVDTTEVPDLAKWGDEAKVLIEEWYPRMVNLLGSEGYVPPARMGLKFKKTDEGVAYTVRDNITVSSHWVEKHPEDTGMVIHEMIHVIQAYPGRSGPGWVTEGIADYLRYAVYEGRPLSWFPNSADPKGFTKGYNMTAGFFLWMENDRAPGIVANLNAHMRKGTYKESLFEEAAGKPLLDLWQDYLTARRQMRESARKG